MSDVFKCKLLNAFITVHILPLLLSLPIGIEMKHGQTPTLSKLYSSIHANMHAYIP